MLRWSEAATLLLDYVDDLMLGPGRVEADTATFRARLAEGDPLRNPARIAATSACDQARRVGCSSSPAHDLARAASIVVPHP
jgi:riboflavin biosynthesis pyrimidine reductase